MVRIVCVGKLSAPYKDLCDEFGKRIQRWTKLETIELKEAKADIASAMRKESEEMQKHLKGQVLILEATGKHFDTPGFAQLIKKQLASSQDLTFVIGSHYGVADGLKKKYPCISLSPLTMSHELARVVLYEQIYRAFCVINNHPYAK